MAFSQDDLFDDGLADLNSQLQGIKAKYLESQRAGAISLEEKLQLVRNEMENQMRVLRVEHDAATEARRKEYRLEISSCLTNAIPRFTVSIYYSLSSSHIFELRTIAKLQ
jgi:hypothetical protein